MKDVLYELQDSYLSTGKNLDKIYKELLRLGSTILTKLLLKKGVVFQSSKIEQIIHDASTHFIEYNYLTNKRTITHFYTILELNIKQQLGYAKKGKFSKEKHWDKLEPIYNYEDTILYEPFLRDDKDNYIKELADKDIFIPYVLYRERSFKSAVLKIKNIGGDNWTIQNWNKLHEVYMMLKKKRKSYQSGYLKNYITTLRKN